MCVAILECIEFNICYLAQGLISEPKASSPSHLAPAQVPFWNFCMAEIQGMTIDVDTENIGEVATKLAKKFKKDMK